MSKTKNTEIKDFLEEELDDVMHGFPERVDRQHNTITQEKTFRFKIIDSLKKEYVFEVSQNGKRVYFDIIKQDSGEGEVSVGFKMDLEDAETAIPIMVRQLDGISFE